jgi:hypothetical protein
MFLLLSVLVINQLTYVETNSLWYLVVFHWAHRADRDNMTANLLSMINTSVHLARDNDGLSYSLSVRCYRTNLIFRSCVEKIDDKLFEFHCVKSL